MVQTQKTTDEQLVALAQQGDDDAFTEIFLRYQKALERHANKASARFPTFYEDEFYGYFQERFIQIVNKFDVNSGVYFAKFCSFKFPKLAHDYVRRRLFPRNPDGTQRESARDRHKVIPSDLGKVNIEDNRFTPDYQIDVQDTELYAHLTSLSDINARIIALLVQGYTYQEIALKLGKSGNDAALRNWTSRLVRKLKEETITFYRNSESLDEVGTYARSIG